jgi:hypothetical protein
MATATCANGVTTHLTHPTIVAGARVDTNASAKIAWGITELTLTNGAQFEAAACISSITPRQDSPRLHVVAYWIATIIMLPQLDEHRCFRLRTYVALSSRWAIEHYTLVVNGLSTVNIFFVTVWIYALYRVAFCIVQAQRKSLRFITCLARSTG